MPFPTFKQVCAFFESKAVHKNYFYTYHDSEVKQPSTILFRGNSWNACLAMDRCYPGFLKSHFNTICDFHDNQTEYVPIGKFYKVMRQHAYVPVDKFCKEMMQHIKKNDAVWIERMKIYNSKREVNPFTPALDEIVADLKSFQQRK